MASLFDQIFAIFLFISCRELFSVNRTDLGDAGKIFLQYCGKTSAIVVYIEEEMKSLTHN